MSEIIQKTDYSENLTNVLEQYKDSTKLQALIDSPNISANDIEQALFEIRDEFYVDTAVGAQLDVLGIIFQVPRAGLNDTEYRTQIKLKGGLLSGSGEPEFIISVLKSLYGATSVKYYPGFPSEPASYTVISDSTITEPELNIFSPAGVRGYVGGYLLQEDGTSFILQEDGVSKIII
jgi:hypothetical protein